MQKKIHCIIMKPEIVYPCRVMAKAVKSSPSNLDGVQNRLFFTLQSLLPQTQSCKPIATLTLFSLRYLYLQVQIFTTRTCHVTPTESNHPHFLRKQGNSIQTTFSFFLSTATPWNKLPFGCFLEHNNLNLFNSRINRPLSLL